ncbi:MAG: FMN-binding protein [Bacteroidota bacterium]
MANKVKFHNSILLFCGVFLILAFSDAKISPRLQQKLNAAVQGTFEVEAFTLQAIAVAETFNDQTLAQFGSENMFKVLQNDQLLGYAYLGQAPSMKNIFDYVVLFHPNLTIKKSKVLIYREDYGRQIGSQRWLKQFIGKKWGDPLVYGEDIDAISGATISAKSMTKAINDVLTSMKVLQKNGLLK